MFSKSPLQQCWFCKHFQPEKSDQNGESVCKAFPNGIPRKISENKYDHREPFQGDSNIQFEILSIEELNLVFPRATEEELNMEVRKIISLLNALATQIDDIEEE